MKPVDTRVTRRRFGAMAGSTVASIVFGEACFASTKTVANAARLTARPRNGSTASLESGPLGLGGGERDGMIQLPSPLPAGNIPLLLFLHGATQNGAGMMRRIGPPANEAGVAVVAPDS